MADHHETATQFNHVGQILLNELIGEMEHVRGSQNWLPFFVHADIRTIDVAITAQNLFGSGIPDNKLPIGVLHGIVFVNIDRKL